MPETREGLQKLFGELLGGRFHSAPGGEGLLGEFLPLHAGDVRRISEAASRHGVPLSAAGGGTASAEVPREGVVVNTELMRRFELRHNGGGWAEAEPGVRWLALDDELRRRGKGLAVYPTSAPRATVGGWLAMDGLGVGSFEHGWLHENVLAADVVLPGGQICELSGRELPGFLCKQRAGIVVNARLRTRRADTDRPFAVAFEDREALLSALGRLARQPEAVPAWHVGFLSPAMAAMRGLSPAHLMFGAYPGYRFEELDEAFTFADQDGERLDSRTAYRIWGERFYPVTPSNPAPPVRREFTTVESLLASPAEEGLAVQGTLARSGEVLLLAIENEPGRPENTASPAPRGRIQR